MTGRTGVTSSAQEEKTESLPHDAPDQTFESVHAISGGPGIALAKIDRIGKELGNEVSVSELSEAILKDSIAGQPS